MPEEKAQFQRELLVEDYAILSCDNHAISDVAWGEMKPVVVTVRDGIVQDVVDIPSLSGVKRGMAQYSLTRENAAYRILRPRFLT